MINKKNILNENNEKLFIETYTPETVKATIIFCHGITGCRKGRTMADNYFQDLAKLLMDLNFKVVLFDFSGHGESEGKDVDVCLSKSTKELKKVFLQETVDVTKVNFLAFSYGATVLCNFLSQNSLIKPQHIIMYSPCLFPLKSCFLNENSMFGKDIVKDYKNGMLQKNGYALVGAKKFYFGRKMIDDCNNFTPDYLRNLSDIILVLSGKNDVILNTKYNEDFCTKNKIKNIYLNASHSLFEEISKAFDLTISALK